MPSRTMTVVLVALFLTVPGPAGAEKPAKLDIWQAAAEGDTARVATLLDVGTDVDAATPYGATALTYASDKGHTEVVRLLLERGADPNVEDTFYHQTPLAWALGKGHFDVAELLLEHGATGAEYQVLFAAARAGHTGLAQAVLERWQPYVFQRDAALEAARTAEHEEVVKVLAAAELQDLPEIELDRATLARYTGVYGKAEQGAVEVSLDPAQGVLLAEVPERGTLVLRPIDEREFRAVDHLDVGLRFTGRSGTIEGALLMDGAATRHLGRVDPAATGKPTETVQKTERPRRQAQAELSSTSSPASSPPSTNWPAFRGHRAAGIGTGEPPVKWNTETGNNVLWRTEIPGLGHSSPVLWGDRIFLTTAIAASGKHEVRTGLTGDVSTLEDDSEHTWKVLALDRRTGELLWQRVAGRAVPETGRHFKSTQANSTPVTDGEHVVAVFPTVGLVCYDVEGNLKWRKDLGALDAGWFYDPSYDWGFASSPVIFENRVIVQADVEGGGFVAAFRLEDGEQIWRTERDDVPGFSTPTIFESGTATELVTNGSIIRGYDPRTGKELWRLAPNSELPIATPVVADDLVIVTAGYPPLKPIYAVRPGARGDISLRGKDKSEAVAWSHGRGGAYMPTPLVYGGLLYLVHHDGRLEVYDVDTGQRVYRARFSRGGTFTGSPVAAEGRVYFPTEDGEIYVVKAGSEYEELAINAMGEVVMATPAISNGVLFVRSLRHLWALGSEDEAEEQPAESAISD